VISQKISALLIGTGMIGATSSDSEFISSFGEHSAEYTLIASISIGLLGIAVMAVINLLKFGVEHREQKAYNKRVLEETERHNRATEPKE